MAVLQTDIQVRLSGGAANADPNAALGGAMSSVAFVDNVIDNLFDDVTGDEASAGDTEYRGIYARNGHASLTLSNAVIWFDGAGGLAPALAARNIDMGIAVEAVDVTMATIANESTAPSSVVFTRPTSKGTGLQLNSTTGLAAGSRRGVWLRRVIVAGATPLADAFSFRVEGDSLP